MKIHFTPSEHGASHNNPKIIVVHGMAEFLLDPKPIHATDFLEKVGFSAHVLVDSRGDIFICRDNDQGAYHARGYNKDSLGIEFLVEGHHTYGSFIETIKSPWVNDPQWVSGVNCVRNWVIDYKIPREKVFRHSDLSPGRKVDPGKGFKWEMFLDEVFA